MNPILTEVLPVSPRVFYAETRPPGGGRRLSGSKFLHMIVLLVVLVGGNFPTSGFAAESRPQVLDQNDNLPWKSIQDHVPAEVWKIIRNRPLTAFLSLQGVADSKGRIKVRRIVQTYPEESWKRYLPGVMKSMRITAEAAASRIDPAVKATILFYDAPEGYTAFVFAERDSVFGSRSLAPSHYWQFTPVKELHRSQNESDTVPKR